MSISSTRPFAGTTASWSSLTHLLSHASPLQALLLAVAAIGTLSSGTYLAYEATHGTFVDLPRSGGTYREAIIGTPRFINPILAVSAADRDLTALIYAGLMTRNETGELVPQLAEHYTRSDDGTTYTFTLRKDISFHDDVPVTAHDVVYTVEQAANASVRSPRFANWDGVRVEAPDPHTVVFTLPEPYAPFIENTTLGILPRHIWEPLSPEEMAYSQLNIEPIGAGPYQLDAVLVDKSGIPTSYELTAFASYVFGAPHIARFHAHLYPDRSEALAAYQANRVHGVAGIAPVDVEALLRSPGEAEAVRVLRTPLLRIFGIFLNHNKQPLFRNKAIREALHVSIDRTALVGDILYGYGTPIEDPVLPLHLATPSTKVAVDALFASTTSTSTVLQRITAARALLEEDGWERSQSGSFIMSGAEDEPDTSLAFRLSTVDNPDLVRTADFLKREWGELGANVTVDVYGPSDLSQSIIRTRGHEALLFGIEVGHGFDLYAFWHSSQRNDPGLNVAQFADIEADVFLEDLRIATSSVERAALIAAFVERTREERAGIFLYAPDLIYLTREDVHDVSLHPMADPSERFDQVHAWYLETDRVWPWVRKWLD